jgi:hypothetical protein
VDLHIEELLVRLGAPALIIHPGFAVHDRFSLGVVERW